MDETTRWPHDALLHAWWVEPGRLLAGEYPGTRTAEKTAKKLQLLVDAVVGTIVDLTRPEDHLEPYREALRTACERAGIEIRYFAHPIPDMDVLDQAGYDGILACIRGEIDCGRVVYLHCWGGKGRTSTVVGCLLIDEGLDYDAAIARIAELRAGTRKSAEACPEAPSQHRVLQQRALRRS
jgi:protein-tyrosine phosphatase